MGQHELHHRVDVSLRVWQRRLHEAIRLRHGARECCCRRSVGVSWVDQQKEAAKDETRWRISTSSALVWTTVGVV